MKINPIGHLVKTKPNKAKVNIGKISISASNIKGYGKKAKIHDERYSKQSQTKPIAGLWPEILSTKY